MIWTCKQLHMMTMAIVVLALAAASAQAGPIVYDFVGTGLPSEPVAFHLTVPDFVNPPLSPPAPLVFVSFSCAQLDSSTNCDTTNPNAISFSNQGAGAFSAALSFDAVNNTGYSFSFPTGAFGTPGVYTAEVGVSNPGTLTVEAVPEPNSLLFVFSGILLCGLLVNFRLPAHRR